MSITDFFIRTLYCCIFVWLVLLIYFWNKKRKGDPQSAAHILGVLLLSYYLCGLYVISGIGRFGHSTAVIQWTAFGDPLKYLGSICLFIPLGFLTPLLFKHFEKPASVITEGIMLSLITGFFQMLSFGVMDFKYLIPNTVGTIAGYILYMMQKETAGKKVLKKFRAIRTNDLCSMLVIKDLPLLFICCIQPLLTHVLFQLG